mmetsp:Transcript_1521/g.2707  ORF Transcript_1521/g.2707 Transcript_1521/m.2707 type:complete len:205 (-) Transcript_1521:40-654(-)
MMTVSLLLIASAIAGAFAKTSFCPCVGVPSGVKLVSCSKSFSLAGTCALADLKGDELIQPDIGAGCKVHKEPFQASCTDLTTGETLPQDQQASWCYAPWCYVDPCTCNMDDVVVAEASYFSGVWMAYSYSNCGGADTWKAAAEAEGQKSTELSEWRTAHCHMKCSAIKDYYKKSAECCGMPGKMVPYPMFYKFGHNIPYASMYP